MYEQLEEKAAAKSKTKQPQARASYHYEKRGGYGDVELVNDGKGKSVRKAQLRAASSGEPTSLPTALLDGKIDVGHSTIFIVLIGRS
ncbi:hypothetical protein PF005_g29401 [Phytophthora fragariae]|uniref:Uncharacterized protein n=1 Tax=Phytophthora fragariae TaxID=53985 RepID=A0A6A3H427_9STRA|nr:hypothetical protein PF003_g33126 [Phytophthora fragariae]KAE8923709.1 hypothetical protein PF009_g26043 [Phytophthora fragariae]KAE8964241.1 hypothetical protein PF011_g28743 [Phytophthora fragariae]KAE9063139.1 hypothetical protein PF010_g29121 [Phytophthora fragariae]KAE9065403.1 hypothetical protein PF007_g28856 [Phytophthora fragariae]